MHTRYVVAHLAALLFMIAAAAGDTPGEARADVVPQGDEFQVDTSTGSTYSSVQRTRAASYSPDGGFVVVFDRQGGADALFGQRFDSTGTAVGDPFQISGEPDGSLSSNRPAIAHLEQGNFVVVWNGRPKGSTFGYLQIMGQRFDSGATKIGTEFQVNAATPRETTPPDVAALGGGEFVVAWQALAPAMPGSYNIAAQRFASDASKQGSEFLVNSYTTGMSYDAQIGAAADGSFVVVWTHTGSSFEAPNGRDGAYAGILAQRFNSGGGMVGTEFVVNEFTTYSEHNPDIAVHDDGSFVVVWQTQYGNEVPGGPYGYILSDSVTLQQFDSSGGFVGEEQHVNVYSSGSQAEPSVAMDDDGTFVVVWRSFSTYNSVDDRDDEEGGVFGRCFNANGDGGAAEFKVNSYTTGQDTNISLAGDGGGNFVVTWQRAPNFFSGARAFGRRLLRNGCDTVGGGGISGTKDDNGHLWRDDPVIPYTITVTNDGEVTADIEISETVPARTMFSTADSTPGWSCTPNAEARSTCTITVSNLAPQANQDVIFAVEVLDGTTPLWRVFNVASATSSDVPELGSVRAPETTPYGVCEALGFDPSFCTFLCYFVPIACGDSGGSIVAGAPGSRPRTLASEEDFFFLYSVRDDALASTRGGQRFTDLFYENSAALVAAAMSDPQVATLAMSVLTAEEAGMRKLAEGNGDSTTISQAGVDAMNAFLDAAAAAGSAELAATIARERARLGIDDWVGMSLTEAVAELNSLTCEGFETTLFCAEINGDCRITATDALAILLMAVGTNPAVGEADVDGNGSVSATDALQALLIAVGALPNSTACNA